MTDQELIARLLDEETDLADCAVDRIKELVEERDTARRLLGAATQMQIETQAQLTKAVEALRFYTHDYVFSGSKARAMLAELEKE